MLLGNPTSDVASLVCPLGFPTVPFPRNGRQLAVIEINCLSVPPPNSQAARASFWYSRHIIMGQPGAGIFWTKPPQSKDLLDIHSTQVLMAHADFYFIFFYFILFGSLVICLGRC